MGTDLRPEAQWNALLRRVDWRFLLPRPHATHAVCFAAGALTDAVALVAEHVWRAAGPVPDGACDLAVAVNPNGRTLRAAWQALAPGGACYTEWRRWPWHSVAGVRRRLERAGFVNVACYAARPDPDAASPALWVSLDSDGAVRHFLARSARERSRPVRHALRRGLWLAAPRLRYAPTICAFARKPAAVPPSQDGRARVRPPEEQRRYGAPTLPDGLLDTIRSGWSSWGFGETPEQLGLTLLTGGRRSINKVVALTFAGADPTPRLAVKMARVSESSSSLLNEARALEVLQARPTKVEGVPRLLFCRTDAGVLALGQTALVGRPLSRALRRENGAELAARATDWLVALAGEPCHGRPGEWRRVVDPVVAEFEATFGAVTDPGMLREAKQALDELGALRALPEVHEQRDFGPWNLLLTSGESLAVLDWESSEPRGLPVLDLVYFLSYFAFYLERASDLTRYREAYRATLDPSTLVGGISAACLARYVERMQLPAAALRPLRLLTWMLHSRSEYRQFTADAAGRPSPKALRQSVFLALWEEEVRRRHAD